MEQKLELGIKEKGINRAIGFALISVPFLIVIWNIFYISNCDGSTEWLDAAIDKWCSFVDEMYISIRLLAFCVIAPIGVYFFNNKKGSAASIMSTIAIWSCIYFLLYILYFLPGLIMPTNFLFL